MERLLDRNETKQMDKDTMQGLIPYIYESGKHDAATHAVDYDTDQGIDAAE